MTKPIPIERQIAAAKREVAMRINVYKKRVDAGQMNPTVAEAQTDDMRAILSTLQEVQEHGVNEISKEEAQAVITAALSNDNDAVPDMDALNRGIDKLRRLAE